jgi:CRP-like cAMP-binding protein
MQSNVETAMDTPFLKDLTRAQRNLLTPLFESFKAPGDAQIFEQGDQAEYLYLILRGTVMIRYKPYDGPKITLTRLHAGDVFGWSAVAGGKTYASDAVSMTEVETLRIPGAELRRLCLEHPDVGYSILEKLAEAVSPRWKNAKGQIQNMLHNKMHQER